MDNFDEDIQIVLNPQIVADLAAGPLQVLLDFAEQDETPERAKYVEEIVPRYTPHEFFSHFRMSRPLVQVLCEEVGNRLEVDSTIPIMKKILFSIWMLAKPESFLSCCDRFGLSTGSGHLIFHEICAVLCDMRHQEISWPTVDETRLTAQHFQNKYQFSGVIGAIDGCHIPIKAPKNNANDYYNRHSYHSMILQAVCDHKLLFIDIFVGMPGRVHDARVFRNSPLHARISNEQHFISPSMHLLGDSAYPLSVNLVVPFRDNGHLTPQQHHFNTVLSKCRSKIEQAFGRLKSKWRRLKFLDMDINNVPIAITAACVLHNFCLRREAADEDAVDEALPENVEFVEEAEVQEAENENAFQKRLHLMNNLN